MTVAKKSKKTFVSDFGSTLDPRRPFVYFGMLYDPHSGGILIKIGSTAGGKHGVFQRQEAHNRRYINYQFICALPASSDDDNAIREYFAFCKTRDGREDYFYPDPQLVNYIRWLRECEFVYRDDDEKLIDMDTLMGVDFGVWRPAPEKQSVNEMATFSERSGRYDPLDLRPVVMLSKNAEFYIGDELARCLHAYGPVDLDPASDWVGNQWIKAAKIHTKHNSGMLYPWHGTVWVYAPHSDEERWAVKLVHEYRIGNVTSGFMLIRVRQTSNKGLQCLWNAASVWGVSKGRIQFRGWDVNKDASDESNALFYFGNNPDRFFDCFGRMFNIIAPYKRSRP